MNSVEKTAYHEADHVVAANLLGYEITFVTINSDNDACGRVG